MLSDLENLMHQKINALPGFGYVLKFNNARIDFLSKDKRTCSCLTFLQGPEKTL